MTFSKNVVLILIGGSYSLFAGRDATRALSKMQLDPSLFSNEYDDLNDLTDKERSTARNWHEDFRGKILFINKLKRIRIVFIFKKNMILLVVF
jgi:hypothetical protein